MVSEIVSGDSGITLGFTEDFYLGTEKFEEAYGGNALESNSHRQALLMLNTEDAVTSNLTTLDNATQYHTQMHEPPSYTCLLYDFSVETIAMGILCLLGFIGNILSMICLWKDKSKTATPFLLVSLEIADTLFLITVFFLRVLSSIGQFTRWPIFLPIYPYLAKYVYPLAMVFETATIYLTLLVTINRYISVCLPYQASDLCSVQNARKQVAVVWIFCCIYNIPRFMEYQIKTISPTMKAAIPNDLVENDMYKIIYINILYFLVMFLVPLITLCILNARLISALKRTKRKRKQLIHSEHSSRSEDDITFILIVVVMVFVFTQTPALITQLLISILPDRHKGCPNASYYYVRFSDLLVVLNSSINFIIYCFCSRRFRQVLIRSVCKIGSGRMAPDDSMMNGHTHARKNNPQLSPAGRSHTKYTTLGVRPAMDVGNTQL